MKASVPAPWPCLSVPPVRAPLRVHPDSVLPELPPVDSVADSLVAEHPVQPPAEPLDSVLLLLLAEHPADSVPLASVQVAWA